MRTGCNFAGKPLRQSEHIGHFREKNNLGYQQEKRSTNMTAQGTLETYRCCFCGKYHVYSVNITTTKVDIKEFAKK